MKQSLNTMHETQNFLQKTETENTISTICCIRQYNSKNMGQYPGQEPLGEDAASKTKAPQHRVRGWSAERGYCHAEGEQRKRT